MIRQACGKIVSCFDVGIEDAEQNVKSLLCQERNRSAALGPLNPIIANSNEMLHLRP